MHPADQFDAFKQQIDAGKTIEETADAFGVSATVVRKRMKLAAVAPEIMKAFRKDEIDLNAVAAYRLFTPPAPAVEWWCKIYRRTDHRFKRSGVDRLCE